LRRLPHIESDYFPILAILDYAPGAGSTNDEPQTKPGDEEEAGEAIEKGKANH
jgi:hypothetical protein